MDDWNGAKVLSLGEKNFEGLEDILTLLAGHIAMSINVPDIEDKEFLTLEFLIISLDSLSDQFPLDGDVEPQVFQEFNEVQAVDDPPEGVVLILFEVQIPAANSGISIPMVDGHARTVKFDRSFEAQIPVLLEELREVLDPLLIGFANEARKHALDLTSKASGDWGLVFKDTQLLRNIQPLGIPFAHKEIIWGEREACEVLQGKNQPLTGLSTQFDCAEPFTTNPFILTGLLSFFGEEGSECSWHP